MSKNSGENREILQLKEVLHVAATSGIHIGRLILPIAESATEALEAVNPALAASTDAELRRLWPMTNESEWRNSLAEKLAKFMEIPDEAPGTHRSVPNALYSGRIRGWALGEAYRGEQPGDIRDAVSLEEGPELAIRFVGDLRDWTARMVERGYDLRVLANMTEHGRDKRVDVFANSDGLNDYLNWRLGELETNFPPMHGLGDSEAVRSGPHLVVAAEAEMKPILSQIDV